MVRWFSLAFCCSALLVPIGAGASVARSPAFAGAAPRTVRLRVFVGGHVQFV